MKHKDHIDKMAPDSQPITDLQAQRLAKVSGLEVKEITGLSIADIREKFKWHIDPEILFFRRICGRVVKHDAATGINYPVPFATVHVEDTDCSFLGLFPTHSHWWWGFPYSCRREEIATVKTDACGNFCVFIPRFEIDWILRWRFERFCYPEIFVKPSIRDLLEKFEVFVEEHPPIIRPPHGPGPDPAPFSIKNLAALNAAGSLLGPAMLKTLEIAARKTTFGTSTSALNELLERPAFAQSLAPPMPEELLKLHQAQGTDGQHGSPNTLHVGKHRAEKLDLQNYVGPFLRTRCKDVLIPELVPIIDVPDITFRVTQDVNGDGVEEVIYAEGLFDVRWDSGPIPNVTLHASAIALSSLSCDQLQPIDCETLGIRVVGEYQLINPAGVEQYYDATTGYATRPNRPHLDGAIRPSVAGVDPLATAPFASMLLLRGCNRATGAQHYRVKYRYNGSTEVPFVGLTWHNFPPLGGLPTLFSPDINGWYPIDTNPTNWMIPNLLLAWPSASYADGEYDIVVELGDGTKNHLADLPSVKLRIDNSTPVVPFKSLKWRPAQSDTDPTSPAWIPLPLNCPVVRRPVSDIEFLVEWQVSATHLLDASLSTNGCGSASSILALRTPVSTVEHWHTGQLNNSVIRTAIFRLNYAADNQGAYAFSVNGFSRAIDPGNHTGFVADWQYDHAIYGGTLSSIQVAVVNA